MEDSKKPLILVSNDDGIMSKGLSALIRSIRPLGEIVVVAPDSPRSGTSGTITVDVPINYHLIRKDVGLSIYKCSGTPADCVKIGVDQICERKPDLFIAGINHGDNSATNVFNSGTMGATIEACLDGISSIAFSLCNHESDADFEPAVAVIRPMSIWALNHPLPQLTCLNINFPDIPQYKGVKVCKMARGYWSHEFDPCPRRGDNNYFWLVGKYVDLDVDNEPSDRWALARGYVAVTPTRLDITDYQLMDSLQNDFNSLVL